MDGWNERGKEGTASPPPSYIHSFYQERQRGTEAERQRGRLARTTRSGRLEATSREIQPPTPEPTKMTGDLVMRRSMRKMVSAVQRLTVPEANSPGPEGFVQGGERKRGERVSEAVDPIQIHT